MMTNKKITLIIGLQALLIVILFWMLIFYGKDEYDSYRVQQEEEIEGANRVTEKEGISVVNLSPAVQKNSGITTAKIEPMHYKGNVKSIGNVIAIDALIEAKAKFLAYRADLAATRAASQQNLNQYHRLVALNADDKNVSDRAVQEALALVNADQARQSATEQALKNLQANIALQWGDDLAKLASNDSLSPQLDALIHQKSVLVQVSLPESIATNKAPRSIQIAALSAGAKSLQAHYLSPAMQADPGLIGKTFYYTAPAEQLRVGMRVNVEIDTSKVRNGVVIPNNAVIWYAGQPWAYFKQGANHFVRKPISAELEVANGWFNENISPQSEVVVTGAQLLLSEEFKYLIKNENED